MFPASAHSLDKISGARRFVDVFAASCLLLFAMNVLFCTEAAAARRYVTDQLEITLRSGPSVGNKVLRMLSSGELVNVLETRDGWSRVRVLSGGSGDREGWVISRYLITRAPYEQQVTRYKEENEKLKSKLERLESDHNEISTSHGALEANLRVTSEELETVRQQYIKLKEDAAGYLELKEEHRKTTEALNEALNTVRTLTRENEDLRFSQKARWFIYGAAVLLCGWLIGLIMGRSQRKQRGPYIK